MNTTIIIPSYNQSEYLDKAICSALLQPATIIVVDDGSTDNSLEIALKYQKYGVKVISQVNKGLASARNTGIMNADTDFILPLDADDYLEPGAVSELENLITTQNADIASGSFKCFGVSEAEVILGDPKLGDFITANRVGYCSLIRRSALLEIGGYNPKMVQGWEDWDVWIDLLKRGKKLVTTPRILWRYRTKENSMYTESVKHAETLSAQMRKNHPEVYE